MAKDMYQNIILELADGRLIRATVPAFCHIGDKVSVRDIRVTNPKKLEELSKAMRADAKAMAVIVEWILGKKNHKGD